MTSAAALQSCHKRTVTPPARAAVAAPRGGGAGGRPLPGPAAGRGAPRGRRRAMALLPALLLLLLPLAALALALATVLLGLPSYDIPPGVNQPAKLRLVLAVLLSTAALVSRAPQRRAHRFGGRGSVSTRAGGGWMMGSGLGRLQGFAGPHTTPPPPTRRSRPGRGPPRRGWAAAARQRVA